MNPEPSALGPTAVGGGPFALEDDAAYQRWRDEKLARYPHRAEDLIVEVRDPRRLSTNEAQKLRAVCRCANMAIYASTLGGVADKDLPRRLGAQLGLTRLDANPLADDDGITSLSVAAGKAARGYVPYSSQRLLWHTDGYYNAPGRRIGAFILHCVHPAPDGGANRLLDPEIAYILLREADPGYIRALSEPEAMTIPANIESGAETRPARVGPVFSVDSGSGCLHMRYTARTRSIEWATDAATRASVQFLSQLLGSDTPHAFTHTLAGGQGLVCNNVLHDRTAFTAEAGNAPPRLVYRARYRDRIAGTG